MNSFVAGRAVSFQVTILKVLAGHPDGRASVTELTRYVSILMSSGSDWSDPMCRLARAPRLEIFGDGLCCGTIAVGASRIREAVPGNAGNADARACKR